MAFNGSNASGSTFNVGSGGLVNVGSAASIGGQLHVSGSAVISGSVATNADVIVQSGGTVTLVDGATFSQTNLANAGTLVVDRTSALSLATAISGTGGLQKTGNGALTLAAANTFTGPISLLGGSLSIDGSVASGVAASAGTTLGGSGAVGGSLSGAGLVSPGNSPGILSAAAFDPTGGLDGAFEFTALSPNYAASGSGALNDVLRLTGTAPFVGSTLTSGNVIDVYFNVGSILPGQTYQGGFFTGQTEANLLSSVQNGTFNYWLMTTGSGSRTFNGVTYNPLTYASSGGVSEARLQTRQITTDFGAGSVTGSVTEFVTARGTLANWTGGAGDGNWSNAGNWTSPVTDSGVYDLVFGGTTRPITSNNVGTVSVSSITFTNSGTTGQNAVFTIGGSPLTLVSATISTNAASFAGVFGPNTDGDTISAPMTLTGTSTIITNNNHNLTLTGVISGTGALILDDGSPGTTEYVYISGSNTYSGGTWIRGGIAQAGARAAAASNNNAFGSGPVTVSDNGTILVRNNSVIANPLTISGTGINGSSLIGSFGTANQLAEYSGPITVVGNTRFSTASSALNDTTSQFRVSGPVDLGANTLTLRSGTGRLESSRGLLLHVTGSITGAGGIVVDGAIPGSRTMISGSNSYSGGTTITTGTLIVGNGSALGTGFLAVNTSGLDLNGQTLNVGALSGSSAGVIGSGTTGGARLVTTTSTDSTYAGTIVNGLGTVGLTKAGSGVLSLTGNNTYTGVTAIDGGVLALDGANAINGGGAIAFGGGTLRYSGANQVDFSAQISQSSAAISIDTNGQTVTFANAISDTNTGGLTKLGAGTLRFGGVNVYSGITTVWEGTLGGTGSVAGLLSVGSGATFDPGSGAGSTAIFGVGAFAQTMSGTTVMQVLGLTAGSQHDQVLFSGPSRTVSWGGLLDLTLQGSYADHTSFDLFSGFSSQTGDLDGINLAATGTPYDGLSFSGPVGGVWRTGATSSGQYLEFSQITGVLNVVPVPEPAGVVSAAVGLLTCAGLWRGRRRLGSGVKRGST